MSAQLKFVHEFVPGTSRRTLLLLHGTGGDERDLLPLGREIDPAAALLSPRGQVTENGQARFFRRLAQGVFDIEDLKRRTDELADFILDAAEEYRFDLAQLVAVGYSNGANITSSMLLRRPTVLRSAVLLRPMVPFEPISLPDLTGVRIWIGGGKEDMIIPRENTERLAAILSDAGAEVTAHFFDGGHALTNVELVLVQRWLRATPPAA
jgi:predicted esterase